MLRGVAFQNDKKLVGGLTLTVGFLTPLTKTFELDTWWLIATTLSICTLYNLTMEIFVSGWTPLWLDRSRSVSNACYTKSCTKFPYNFLKRAQKSVFSVSPFQILPHLPPLSYGLLNIHQTAKRTMIVSGDGPNSDHKARSLPLGHHTQRQYWREVIRLEW